LANRAASAAESPNAERSDSAGAFRYREQRRLPDAGRPVQHDRPALRAAGRRKHVGQFADHGLPPDQAAISAGAAIRSGAMIVAVRDRNVVSYSEAGFSVTVTDDGGLRGPPA
jgi:hypothetical protein